MLRFLFLLLLLLLLGGIGYAVYQSDLQDKAEQQHLTALWQAAAETPAERYHPDQLAPLPPPVRRYLGSVLMPGMALNSRVRLRQHGTFNVGSGTAQWLPFKATAHVTTTPPGRVWDARISIAPPLAIRVIDRYQDGKGGLYGTVLGAVPIVDAPPAKALDEGELMTWLAESVWFPTALLPGNGVSWEAIDEHSARATVDDGHQRVSLDFHFNGDNEVVRISSQARGREENGSYRPLPWSCRFRHYDWIDNVRVPREGEVMWHLPSGEWSYMRARIDRLEYDPPR